MSYVRKGRWIFVYALHSVFCDTASHYLWKTLLYVRERMWERQIISLFYNKSIFDHMAPIKGLGDSQGFPNRTLRNSGVGSQQFLLHPPKNRHETLFSIFLKGNCLALRSSSIQCNNFEISCLTQAIFPRFILRLVSILGLRLCEQIRWIHTTLILMQFTF